VPAKRADDKRRKEDDHGQREQAPTPTGEPAPDDAKVDLRCDECEQAAADDDADPQRPGEPADDLRNSVVPD
jgi:hypothetical protein